MPERCELLIRARALAAKRGLDNSQINCPIISICSGERCVYINPETAATSERGKAQIHKFNDRLHAWAGLNGKQVAEVAK